MCLGIPMKIVKIEGDRAVVRASGIERKIWINFLKEPRVGEYVIVHAGFAIEKIDPEEARETLKMLDSIK